MIDYCWKQIMKQLNFPYCLFLNVEYSDIIYIIIYMIDKQLKFTINKINEEHPAGTTEYISYRRKGG